MTRPPLSERRRTHTRREIAESAVTLFARDGYDNVSVEDIAEEAGISLRTFYRYFSAKDEVLSPIFTQATEDLLDHIARRPAAEDLAEAVEHGYRQSRPPHGHHAAPLAAAVFVPAPRVTLEQSPRAKSAEPLADTLSRALRYLRNG